MSKPSVFVGSSSEELRVAREIQSQLADVGEVERWDQQDVFALGAGTLESLVQALNRFDFGVFVLTPDDLIISRGAQQNSARDNVLIELGLFMGRLGRERTFLVCCKDDEIKIPSDLAGITFATYSKSSDGSRLTPALAPACNRIRNAIEIQGKAADLQKLKNKVDAQGEQLEDQQKLINQVVSASMSPDVFHHLAGVTILREYFYWENDEVNCNREFYDLKHRGFIEAKPGKFCEFYKELNGKNITENVQPTRIGLIYVKLRKEDIPKEWLYKNNPKLNIDVAQKELGLEIAGNGTISAS